MRREIAFSKFGFSRSLPSRPSCVRSVVNAGMLVVVTAVFVLSSPNTLTTAIFVNKNEASKPEATILLAVHFAFNVGFIILLLNSHMGRAVRRTRSAALLIQGVCPGAKRLVEDTYAM